MNRAGLLISLIVVCLLTGCKTNSVGESPSELKTSSDQTDIQKRAGLRLQLAIGYYEQHQMQVALDEVKQALQADPDLADAFGVRALIYMDMGETRLAEDNFLRALKLVPGNPDFSNNYGWFLCQNGHEGKSIEFFEVALKSRTYQSPAKALNNAGVCSLKLKKIENAEHYFLQAFQYDPSNQATNVNLAKIFFDRKDFERARFYIGRATKADVLSANVLWLAVRIEHRLGDKAIEASLATQLRRRHPGSPEYAAFQRGAFDE